MRIASNSFPYPSKGTAQAGLSRALVTAFIFAAFLLQSFIAQTHIHPGPGPVSSVTEIANKAVHHAPVLPGNSDEAANCPQCQAIAHASAYVPPAVLAMLVRHGQNASPPVIAARDMRADYQGHRKQQRGPPSI
jgi:hypothetical protein